MGHRDLKPENILLVSKASDTEIQISDFGLAKRSTNGRYPRSRSICGSDFYLAPEVISNLEYGQEVDMWAIGIITYVVLCGSVPFYDGALHELYKKILECWLSFSEDSWKDVSDDAQDFITSILQFDAASRLT